MQKVILSYLMMATSFFSCAQKTKNMNQEIPTTKMNVAIGTEVATFAEGCFWCTESFFQRLEGVISVTSGYSGGHVANPSYDAVCTKTTGHAEGLHIVFDPKKISYDELLEVFWKTHDPTTLNQQGADVGPQYRSVVFYHTEEQKAAAEKYKAELDKVGAFKSPIVTAITKVIDTFGNPVLLRWRNVTTHSNIEGKEPHQESIIVPNQIRKAGHAVDETPFCLGGNQCITIKPHGAIGTISMLHPQCHQEPRQSAEIQHCQNRTGHRVDRLLRLFKPCAPKRSREHDKHNQKCQR